MKSTTETRRIRYELQDKAFFEERKRTEALNAQKTARLKALRLAKEQEKEPAPKTTSGDQ